MEDVRILGEEAEDQPGHEVVHLLAASGGVPCRVFLQQLDVEPVEPAGGLDVEGVFPNLPDRGDAGQREEEAEMIVKIGILAGDRLARPLQAFRLEGLSVSREDEFALLRSSLRASAQRGQRGGNLPFRADLEMDVVPLENAANV